jgi:hypothetical protein
MQKVPEVHETPLSDPEPSLGLGVLACVQELPSHICATVTGAELYGRVLPTATQNDGLGHDRADRVFEHPVGPGSGQLKVMLSARHVVPFHSCAADPAAAMQKLLAQETAKPAGDFGSAVHRVPFQVCAALPMAMQKLGVVQDIPSIPPTALGTIRQDDPFHSSMTQREAPEGLVYVPIAMQNEGPVHDSRDKLLAGARPVPACAACIGAAALGVAGTPARTAAASAVASAAAKGGPALRTSAFRAADAFRTAIGHEKARGRMTVTKITLRR